MQQNHFCQLLKVTKIMFLLILQLAQVKITAKNKSKISSLLDKIFAVGANYHKKAEIYDTVKKEWIEVADYPGKNKARFRL